MRASIYTSACAHTHTDTYTQTHRNMYAQPKTACKYVFDRQKTLQIGYANVSTKPVLFISPIAISCRKRAWWDCIDGRQMAQYPNCWKCCDHFFAKRQSSVCQHVCRYLEQWKQVTLRLPFFSNFFSSFFFTWTLQVRRYRFCNAVAARKLHGTGCRRSSQ